MLLWIQNFDFAILDAIQKYFHNAFFDRIMPVISLLGNKGYLWIFIGISFLLIKKYRTGGVMLLTALIIDVVTCNAILKPIVHRTRPFNIITSVDLLIVKPLDYSFPSGHTAAAFAAATVLYKIDKRFGITAFILATLIAFSRLYLYVHFPTDVILGMILGILCGICGIALMKLIEKKRGM